MDSLIDKLNSPAYIMGIAVCIVFTWYFFIIPMKIIIGKAIKKINTFLNKHQFTVVMTIIIIVMWFVACLVASQMKHL